MERSQKRVKIESSAMGDYSPYNNNSNRKGQMKKKQVAEEEELAQKTLELVELDAQISEQNVLMEKEDLKFQRTMEYMLEIFRERIKSDDDDDEDEPKEEDRRLVGIAADPNTAAAHLFVAALESGEFFDPDNKGKLLQEWKIQHEELTRSACRLALLFQSNGTSSGSGSGDSRLLLDWGNDIPQEFQTDPEFGRSVIAFPRLCSKDLVCHVLDSLPDLRKDRNVWISLMASHHHHHHHSAAMVEEIFSRYAPTAIVADRKRMTQEAHVYYHNHKKTESKKIICNNNKTMDCDASSPTRSSPPNRDHHKNGSWHNNNNNHHNTSNKELQLQQLEGKIIAKNALIVELNKRRMGKQMHFHSTMDFLRKVFAFHCWDIPVFGNDEMDICANLFLAALICDTIFPTNVKGAIDKLYMLDPDSTERGCQLGVSGGVLDWDNVPPALQTNSTFGRKVLCEPWKHPDDCMIHNHVETFSKVFTTLPELQMDRELWRTVVTLSDYYDIEDLLTLAPTGSWEDRDLMIRAVISDGDFLSFVPASLATDLSFVSACVEGNICSLANVSDFIVEQFPDYVKSKLVDVAPYCGVHGEFDHDRLAEKLHQQFNSRPDFFTAWFDAGLPILHHDSFNVWKNDRPLLLQIARWRTWSSEMSFHYASRSLRNDPNFMMEAVGLYSKLHEYSSEKLKAQNFELAMAYLANGDTAHCNNRGQFLRRARAELVQFQTFVNPFLCGLQDPETMTDIRLALNQCNDVKILIAEFVGVPRGKLLHNIRAVLLIDQKNAWTNSTWTNNA